MKILGVSGSLRRASFNTTLLRHLKDLLAARAELEIYLCGDLPLYNQDIDGEVKPDAVVRLRDAITRADALIFATPEYNYGVPGVLKNAIDWASRPAFRSPLTRKPCGIISASKGEVGGVRAQAALKLVLAGTLSPVFPHVEMRVGSVHRKIDETGNLTDPETKEHLDRYGEAFVEWVEASVAGRKLLNAPRPPERPAGKE